MKYCNNCEQMVEPNKHFSWVGFLFGAGIFYLIYYFLIKKGTCPMCNSQNWGVKPSKKTAASGPEKEIESEPEKKTEEKKTTPKKSTTEEDK